MSDSAADRLTDGALWHDFCARLAEAGEVILAADGPAGVLDRAEGFRYLSRLARVGLEMCLESTDPDFPYFYRASHETAKIGADNPDNVYWNATVSGAWIPTQSSARRFCRPSRSGRRSGRAMVNRSSSPTGGWIGRSSRRG